MDYQGEGEEDVGREMHWLVGRKVDMSGWLVDGNKNVQFVCVEIDMSEEEEQGHRKVLGRKHSSPGREVGRLADGKVIGKKDSNKQAGSAW